MTKEVLGQINTQKNIFGNFTNLYSVEKTLRFRLIPQGKTKEWIEKKGLIEEDENRAKEYQQVKKIIDEYHKKFIENALSSVKLKNLNKFADLYFKSQKSNSDKKSLEKLQENLRNQIHEAFKKNEKWGTLFSEKLIKKELPKFTDNESEKRLVKNFDKFTTYFGGFHKNRENLYTNKEKATAIAYRIIHENLPKFLDNIVIYEKIKKSNLNRSAVEKELALVLKGEKLENIFSLNYFNRVLSQKGIDFYNEILGGVAREEGKKIKGINEYVNTEYNQKQSNKNDRIPKLKQLYKQILSDRETSSFVLDKFEDDNELLEIIEKFYKGFLNYKLDGKTQSIFVRFKDLFEDAKIAETSKIYLKNDSLTDLSKRLFGDWSIIKSALSEWYDKHKLEGKKKITKKDVNNKEKWLKGNYFSIQIIEQALEEYESDAVNREDDVGLLKYFSSFKTKNDDEKNIVQKIENRYSDIKDLLNTKYPKDKNLALEKDEVAKIKSFLDTLLEFFHFVKPLNLKEDAAIEKDEGFYGTYHPLFKQMSELIPLYNKVRNYLTRKPYSTEKIKLNFENSTLLAGWDLNKETDNTAVLLRKNNLYYLAIMDKNHNKIFKSIPKTKQDKSVYEKMVYKLLPGPNKMLPKVFLSKKGIQEFKPSEELLEKYKKGTHKKGDNFNLSDCHRLINFFKTSIAKHADWRRFGFKFSDTSSYEDLSEFYREVANQGYKITFQDVPASHIYQLVDEGKLYLFQIYNKDFSPKSKGRPNLHTLYWKMLFDPKNLKDVVYKLNGQAEVFYRKASLNPKNVTVHKANKPIENKNPKNEKKQSVFEYDIIKDKRFTVDKFQFHVPITLNFKSEGRQNLNIKARELIKKNSGINVIGIDRGERHLLYLTLIDSEGKILLQKSLNEIVNFYKDKDGKKQEKHTDYHSLLNKKEAIRDEARKNWGIIENIKELKAGYLSQVVHQITTLMLEYNAVVVMEDLNFGFKRGRQKVEKQVYQKFEKALIDKLNYLVFKEKNAEEKGGILNALQLTSQFKSFKKLGKQSGFIFYVPAYYTSKIDPITGFVDLLKPRYESVVKSQSFFEKFKAITYNPKNNWFEFSFDYNDFTDKASGKTKWVVCTTNHERYRWNKTLNGGKGGQKLVDVTFELKELFEKSGIEYKDGKDLKEKIKSQNSAEFFRKLMWLLSVVLSLRHNNGLKKEEEKDYILSPVKPFFNSLKANKNQPMDADANGAYNIAKKGLWLFNQIRKADDLWKVKLAMSNKEWFEFAQKNTI